MADGMAGGVLVVAEIAATGVVRPVSLELITAGRGLADATGGPLTALVLGGSVEAAGQALQAGGADRTLVVTDDRLDPPSAEATATAVAAAIRAVDPGVVLLPGTTAGRDAAPRVAARIDAPLAADCVGFRFDDGALVATRAVLGGRAQSEVRLSGRPQLATVRSGSFPPPEPAAAGGTVEPFPVEFGPADFAVVVDETTSKGGGTTRLDSAEVVVSGGRGLKEPGNFALVEELAAALGGAVGATRAVVDAGWRPHQEQIGQTGRSVSPRLYVAVGISGAVQHNVGMQGSTAIVAINRDPDAPIFKVAQFGIVGDLFEIVPALTAEITAARA
ncbi:MAG: electron transfer flavoprotein subunit alpha/FixB family protein [Chloroflexia bacterium]|nr:electron transfer flavoprotein subunit alpha/FixB family protein [Chloroflexia bacterium]